MTKKTLYIFIEGADGTGKSTFLGNLYKSLTERGLNVTTTHFIKHTEAGAAFYKEWVSGQHNDFTSALTMLGVTSNALNQLLKLRSEYDVIIVDRSQASFFAYQLSSFDSKYSPVDKHPYNDAFLFKNIFTNSIKNSEFYKCKDIVYKTIYLHCDSEVATERMKQSRGELDHIESRGIAYQDSVKDYYNKCFRTHAVLSPALTYKTGAINKNNSKIRIWSIDELREDSRKKVLDWLNETE